MALICFTSQKGAPGVTLAALSVAAAWPTDHGRHKLYLEADASGGTLALRYGLGLEPGLVTLAVAARRHLDPDALWDHAQELPGGLPVVVGPDNPDRAASVLASSSDAIGRWLGDQPNLDVIVDIGRIGPDAPASDLVHHADLAVMVARPTVEQLQPAAQRLRILETGTGRLGWVLIGEAPHSAAEVTDAFGYDVFGVIADDRRGATALESGAANKRLRRSSLARTASALADTLAELVHPPTPVADTASSREPDEDETITGATAAELVNGVSRGR